MLCWRSEPNSRSMLLPEFQVSQNVGREEEGETQKFGTTERSWCYSDPDFKKVENISCLRQSVVQQSPLTSPLWI